MKLNKSICFKLFLFFIFCVISSGINAQPKTVRVVDGKTQQPMPFVKVVSDSANVQVASNIDGYFSLHGIESDSISLFQLGYATTKLALLNIEDGEVIKLCKSALVSEDTTSWADARQLIQLVFDNRAAHQIQNYNSYKYQAYSKFAFRLTDECRQAILKSMDKQPDSVRLKLTDFVDQQEALLQEGVRTKFYRKPGLSKELIITDRTSGLNDSVFSRLSDQLQTFSLYQDTLSFFTQKYLSPISYSGLDSYRFTLEQKFQTTKGDSLFVVGFKPRKGKLVNGLDGVLTINSDGYAIESLQVHLDDQSNAALMFIINQQYDRLASDKWFPKTMNAEAKVKGLQLRKFPAADFDVSISGKRFITSCWLNIPLDDSFFFQIDSVSTHQAEQTVTQVPNFASDSTDENVSSFANSLGSSMSLKTQLALASWRYPIGKVDVMLDRLANFNRFEGFQLGLGLQTNPSFSQKLSFAGYYRYGFRDHESKYGGDFSFRFDSITDTRFFAHFENDVKEDGNISFLEQPKPFISERLDFWYRTNFTYHEIYQFGFVGRIFPSLLTKVYWKNYRLKNPTFIDQSLTHELVNYQLVGVQFRLTFKEQLFRQRGEIFSSGGKFPVLHFNFERSLDQRSEKHYQAVEFKLTDSYKIRALGESEYTLLGSLRQSDGVVNLLSSPTYSRPQLVANYKNNSFATMHLNEFVTDQLLALFWRHNLGSVLFKGEQHPDFYLVFNAGIGKSEYDGYADFASRYSSISKGYYEGGLVASRLVQVGLLKVGAGAFYRLGPYHLESFKSNLALKFTIDLAI